MATKLKSINVKKTKAKLQEKMYADLESSGLGFDVAIDALKEVIAQICHQKKFSLSHACLLLRDELPINNYYTNHFEFSPLEERYDTK